MRLRTTHTNESNIQGESKAFSIAVNGKAFNILLDGLYTNKIRAVVRELWTNAFDSHVEAGIGGVPFDCHLPTNLDPNFVVRDYGVSLDHEQVMGLYSTVFDSTKDDTDEQVGALGLGSKSPFAYADSFSVIARKDGRKRTYLAAIGGDGTPTITLVSDEESDEAQGLEVSIVARQEDFREFEREARMLAVGFDPVPSVDGVEIETTEPRFIPTAPGANFVIFGESDLPYGTRLAVRQGCVIYPITERDIVRRVDEVMRGFGHTMVLDVPIGAVSVAASREAVQMDTETRDYLLRAVGEAVEAIQAEIDTVLDGCSNRLEAQEAWFGGQHDFSRIFHVKPKWNGRVLDDLIRLGSEHINDVRKDPNVPIVRKGNAKKVDVLANVRFHQRDGIQFVIRRTDKKAKREVMRYREYVKNERGTHADTFLWTDPEPKALARVTRLLGLKPEQIITTHDLPDPGPVKRGPQANRTTGVHEWHHVSRYSKVDDLASYNGDFLYYVVDRVSRQECYYVDQYRDYALHLGVVLDKPILMVTEAAVKRYEMKDSQSLTGVVEAYIARNKAGITGTLRDSMVAERLSGHAGVLGLKVEQIGWEKRSAYIKALGHDQYAALDTEADAIVEQYHQRYPLLFDSTDAAVKAYIALCDEAAEAEGN
jgi:hypothetical protein